MGFRNQSGMIATLRGWHAGRLRALRSARSRELLDAVLPAMLRALSEQADPDAAFMPGWTRCCPACPPGCRCCP